MRETAFHAVEDTEFLEAVRDCALHPVEGKNGVLGLDFGELLALLSDLRNEEAATVERLSDGG